ncbi:unnamed protein product, partial [Brassica rapa subsp. narinosa]
CLWEPKLLLRVGNWAAGACVASSPDSDLEAFSHNPAHGSFAPLAFQPSAITNCANQRLRAHFPDFPLTTIRLDTAGELTSQALNEYCMSMGVRVEHSVAHSNPFPEVTDPFCILPLPTLFHRPEAVHIGDLMWLRVQPGVSDNRSSGF